MRMYFADKKQAIRFEIIPELERMFRRCPWEFNLDAISDECYEWCNVDLGDAGMSGGYHLVPGSSGDELANLKESAQRNILKTLKVRPVNYIEPDSYRDDGKVPFHYGVFGYENHRITIISFAIDVRHISEDEVFACLNDELQVDGWSLSSFSLRGESTVTLS